MTEDEIKNRLKHIINLIGEGDIRYTLSEDDVAFVKENIENEVLDIDEKLMLISYTRDKEFIESYIQNFNFKVEEEKRDSIIALMAYFTNDSLYVKKCIEEGIIDFEKLGEDEKVLLTISLEDINKIKELIQDEKNPYRFKLLEGLLLKEGMDPLEYKKFSIQSLSNGLFYLDPKEGIEFLKSLLEYEIIDKKELDIYIKYFITDYILKNNQDFEKLDPDTKAIMNVFLFELEDIKKYYISNKFCDYRFSILKALYSEGKIEYDEYYQLIKDCFRDKEAYTITQKKDIIAMFSQEQIEECLNDQELYMGMHGRNQILFLLKSEEIKKKYVSSTTLLSPLCRAWIVNCSGDISYIRECLENEELKFNVDAIKNILLRLLELGDIDYVKLYVQRENIDLEIKDEVIKKLNDEELVRKWEAERIEISSVRDLSREELENRPDIQVIKITDEEKDEPQFYTREEYMDIMKSLEEIVEGIERPIKGDLDSELKCFMEVFKRLTFITYNYDCLPIESEWFDDVNRRRCRNLYGGLVQGKAVCGGYAIILKEVLQYLEIECKYIRGTEKTTEDDAHAWNQVKIGEHWFNTDLTWDRKDGRDITMDVLKIDSNFIQLEKFSEDISKGTLSCTVPIRTLVQGFKAENPRETLGKKTTLQEKDKAKGDESYDEI